MEKFNFERNLKNWLICLTVFIAVTMVINGLIALIGWEGDETRFTEGPNRLPPGWIIGLVWTILFIGMASAFWLLGSSTEITSRRKAGEVLAFAIFCLSYPIFTMGFSVHFLVFFGNLFCIVWSSYLTGVLRDISRLASALMVLPAIWVCYATWALITPAG